MLKNPPIFLKKSTMSNGFHVYKQSFLFLNLKHICICTPKNSLQAPDFLISCFLIFDIPVIRKI